MKKIFVSVTYFAMVCFLVLGTSSCKKDEETKSTAKVITNIERFGVTDSIEQTYSDVYDDIESILRAMPGYDDMDQHTRDSLLEVISAMQGLFQSEVIDAAVAEGFENGPGSTSNFTTETYTINYPSVDGSGNAITLSGEVTLGKIAGEYIPVENMLLSCHPTALTSEMLHQTSFQTRVVDGLVVVDPHYIGFGSTSDRHQTYLCQKLIGRNCADMIPAVMDLLRQKGVPVGDDFGTYIIGYSQGAGNALATGRYLQEEAPESLRNLANVKHISCGDGPYDPIATFNYWLTSDSMSLSFVLPLVIQGAIEGHPDIMQGIDILSYFSDVYLSTGVVQSIKEKRMRAGALAVDKSDELSSIYLGPAGIVGGWLRFSGIMSDEVANPDSHIRKALEQCLQAEVITDWTPRCSIELYSSVTDNVLPYVPNTKSAYDNFFSKGCDVTLVNPSSNLDHMLAQINWSYRINTLKAYKKL